MLVLRRLAHNSSGTGFTTLYRQIAYGIEVLEYLVGDVWLSNLHISYTSRLYIPTGEVSLLISVFISLRREITSGTGEGLEPISSVLETDILPVELSLHNI